ncbi:hypothetical protein [Pseudarthrobacter sp. Y6]|uniref:hypothetical protein n=1 Tax=Pseudarthrobacter sp. Y6 TaxID=3418422 RepID=UPI003CEC12D4
MTENIPPIPPAPQSYPSHALSGVIPGNEPPYGPPQPYTQPPPAPYGQQPYGQPQYAPYPPQQYPPTAPWQQTGPSKAKSSGFRVASGIIGIVLGTWLFIPSIAGFNNGSSTAFMAFLILLAALGNITAGILLLVSQRNRTKGAPATSLSTAGFALLLGFIGLVVEYYGAALFVTSLILAAPILIVMGIGLSREKRGA